MRSLVPTQVWVIFASFRVTCPLQLITLNKMLGYCGQP